MSTPGTGDNNSKNTVPSEEPVEDIIPPWLLVGIFACVMALTFWILKDNWYTDMTRFRSLKAQQNGQYEKAIKFLDILVVAGQKTGEVIQAKNPTYMSELGFCHLKLKQYDKALEYYNLAQDYRANLPPDDTGNARPPIDFNNMIGYTYFQKGDLDNAAKALDAALKFNKLDPLANFTMGELAMKRAEYTKAADYFKTVSTNPVYEQQVRKYYAEIEEKLFAGIS